MTKVLPPLEFPSESDMQTAMDMVRASRPSGVYTDDDRKEINRIARQIMLSRKTKH